MSSNPNPNPNHNPNPNPTLTLTPTRYINHSCSSAPAPHVFDALRMLEINNESLLVLETKFGEQLRLHAHRAALRAPPAPAPPRVLLPPPPHPCGEATTAAPRERAAIRRRPAGTSGDIFIVGVWIAETAVLVGSVKPRGLSTGDNQGSTFYTPRVITFTYLLPRDLSPHVPTLRTIQRTHPLKGSP